MVWHYLKKKKFNPIFFFFSAKIAALSSHYTWDVSPRILCTCQANLLFIYSALTAQTHFSHENKRRNHKRFLNEGTNPRGCAVCQMSHVDCMQAKLPVTGAHHRAALTCYCCFFSICFFSSSCPSPCYCKAIWKHNHARLLRTTRETQRLTGSHIKPLLSK